MRPPDFTMLAPITLLTAICLHPFSGAALAVTMSASAVDGKLENFSFSDDDQEGIVKPTKASAPGKPRTAVKQEQQQEEDQVCFLCEQSGDLSKHFGGHSFDRPCHLAVRRHRRLLADAAARARDDAKRKDDPAGWRGLVRLAWHEEGTKYLSRSAVAAHKEHQKQEAFSEEAHQGGVLLLNKRRYKTYVGFWDQVGSETASSDFDKALEDASTDNEKDGQPRVRADKVEEVNWSRGKRSTRRGDDSGSRNRSSRDAKASTTRRRRSRSRRRNVSAGSGPVDRPRGSRSRVPSMSPRSGSVEDRAESECPIDSDAGEGGKRPRRGDRGRGKRRGRAKAEAGNPLMRKHKKTSSAPNARTLFLTAKDELKIKIEKTCHQQALKSSVRGQLKAMLAKLTPDQMEELAKTGETSTLVTKMENVTVKVKGLLDELKSCDAQSLEPIAQNYEKLSKLLDEQVSEGEHLLDAAKLIKNKESEQKRLGCMKDRYRTGKVKSLITPGGYGPVFAKVIADTIHAGRFVEPAQALDAAQVQVYTTAIGNKDIAALVKEYQGHCEGNVNDKAKEIIEELSNHTRKKTLMAKLTHKNSVPDPSSWLDSTSDSLHTDAGAGPWLTAVKTNVAAIGPNFSPLPCVGSFLSAVVPSTVDVSDEADESTTFLICLPITKFIDSGLVALGDLTSFLETDSGSALAKKTISIVELKPDIVCFVPWGTLCVPLCLLDGKEVKVKCIWTLACMSKQLAGKLPPKHRGPIDTMNLEFLQKHSGQAPFQQRLDCYKKLQASIAA